MNAPRRRPSAALIVAILALLVAGAGTSYAASTYVITSSSQIKNGSIAAADLSPKARATLKGQRGPRGYTGKTGTPGATGKPGATGITTAYTLEAMGFANARTLPPGAYTAIGLVTVTDGNGAANTGSFCQLWHFEDSGSDQARGTFANAAGMLTMTVADAFSVTKPTKVWVTCADGDGVAPKIVITKVTALSRQLL